MSMIIVVCVAAATFLFVSVLCLLCLRKAKRNKRESMMATGILPFCDIFELFNSMIAL